MNFLFRILSKQSKSSTNFANMYNLKVLLGIVVIVSAALFCYLQLSNSTGLVVLSAKSTYDGDGADEILQLENVIRNITNATIEQIGTVYSDCKTKDVRTGSLLVREFGNHSKEIWLILQLSPERTVESGLINVRVFYNSNKLYSTHYDLCKKFLPSIKCPISPQRQTYGLRFPLPKFVLSGKYGVEAWTVDQKDRTLACVTAEISL